MRHFLSSRSVGLMGVLALFSPALSGQSSPTQVQPGSYWAWESLANPNKSDTKEDIYVSYKVFNEDTGKPGPTRLTLLMGDPLTPISVVEMQCP